MWFVLCLVMLNVAVLAVRCAVVLLWITPTHILTPIDTRLKVLQPK
jgi:hypothetical protein